MQFTVQTYEVDALQV